MEYYVKSVISIIESNYHKLTSAEKTVADFFIHNNQNTDFSSSHIAELLYTSKATLSRFAKKKDIEVIKSSFINTRTHLRKKKRKLLEIQK